jgi:predicted nucleic acid-binding protein
MRVEELPAAVVVDASVGLKWVIDEDGSDAAVAVALGRGLVTSALFWVEAANALATKERRGELARDRLEDAWRDLLRAPLETCPLGPAETKGPLGLAADLRHPVYDCCYLDLALARRTVVVTADRRFRTLAERQPSLAGSVVHLDDLQS